MANYEDDRSWRNPWVIPVTVVIVAFAVIAIAAIIVSGDDSSEPAPGTTLPPGEPATTVAEANPGTEVAAENPCSSFTETSEEPFLLCDSGPAVATIQQLLTDQGFPVDVDGYYGPDTEAAVISFQESRGLEADGVVGPDTLAALDESGG